MTSFIKPAKQDPLPARIRHARRRKRILIGLLIYSVLGFFVAPALIKWQLCEQLPALTHRQATVEQVHVNPFALSLTIRGFALTETNGAPFAGFDALYVNFQLSSLFRWTWTFSEISVVHPTANLVRLADGSFNFANLVNTNAAPPPSQPATPLPILVQSLLITNGLVTFTDEATQRPFKTSYGPINADIKKFTTRQSEEGPYTFVATTAEGESFAWSGQFSINPPQSSGEFKLLGIPPSKYSPYLAPFTTVQIASGTLDIGARYRVNASAQPLELEVTNATVQLHNFVLRPPATEQTLLALPDLIVTNASASLTGHVAHVGLIALRGGSALIERETNGVLAALKYLLPQTNSATTGAATTTNTPAESWRASLDEFDLQSFSVTVADHSTPGDAELGVDELRLNAKGLSNQPKTPVELALSFDWRGGGTVEVASRGTLLPPSAATTLAITNFALTPLQPYVGQHLNLTVQSGTLNVAGTTEFTPAATASTLLRFTGNVSVADFTSSDTVTYREFARWTNLLVSNINLSLQSNQLAVGEIKFSGLQSSLSISSNGQLNVSALRKTNAALAPGPAADAPAAGSVNFPIRIGALVFEKSSFKAADDSLARHFETSIEEFDGTIRDLAFPGQGQATVDIRGKVSALAPFEVSGEITPDPQHLFVNLKLAFTNSDLTALSPYTEKFLGHPLNKGKLTFDQHYNIENGALKAELLIALDQFTLGARNNSPEATKLPVRLGVALLKDRKGRIDLNLPISGRTDDPEFSISGLVWKAVGNMLLKVATSPFSLLGALVGGGPELQYVDFEPGQAAVTDNQTNKLAKLTQALTERPALNLEIGATFDSTNDLPVIGRQKILEAMKALRIQEIVAKGKPAPTLAELALADDEYERLLRRAYREAFDATPEAALREAYAMAVATNAAPTATGAAPGPGSETVKGASALTRFNSSLAALNKRASKTPGVPAETKPKTERELVRTELETRLLTRHPVTDDDVKQLLLRRIDAAQKYLISTGGIEASRLFPANVRTDDSGKGAARVVFTLN